jgi:hypothetical protein
MEGREPVARDLARRLRGGDFRRALTAVAELRHLDRVLAAHVISSITPADEQRAFQLLIARLVAEGGVRGLAARWSDLPSPQWREKLVSEIGQAIHLWVDEGATELLLAALEDPEVGRQAVGPLIECMRERPEKERKQIGRTLRGKAAVDAWDKMAAWITPARRTRVANAVTAALDRCAANPKALTWPDKYIELLGLSANRTDQRAISLLEKFREMAGETRRSELETLDPGNLPWPTSEISRKKGVPPGTPSFRVWSQPTGLLDVKGLEEAIARIRRREL